MIRRRVAALVPLFAAACGAAPAPAPTIRPPDPAAAVAGAPAAPTALASPTKGSPMSQTFDAVHSLTELCEILSRNGLTLAQGRAALAASADPAVRGAKLVGAAEADEPDHAEVALAAPVGLSALAAAFGQGTEAPRLHWDAPAEVLYYPEAPADRAHTCAIIARVLDAGVQSVAVRRDPRL